MAWFVGIVAFLVIDAAAILAIAAKGGDDG
jgi:hypothetical protein